MRLVQYSLFVLLQFALFPCFGNAGSFKFCHFGTEGGLSQSNVTCILRDKQGFMWFGTRDGLNRYDGYDFDVYKNVPEDSLSLSSNFVTSIMEDRNGDIWVGTWGGGVNR